MLNFFKIIPTRILYFSTLSLKQHDLRQIIMKDCDH
jgi:hypothetical protein